MVVCVSEWRTVILTEAWKVAGGVLQRLDAAAEKA